MAMAAVADGSTPAICPIGRGLVHALRDLRRRRGIVRAQVVDLVHQRHYLVMVEVEGGLPLRHVAARRVVFKVHSGRGDGGITQDAVLICRSAPMPDWPRAADILEICSVVRGICVLRSWI